MARTRGGSFIPVVVALVAIGAFLAWIATQTPERTVAVAEPGDTTGAAQPADTAPAQVVDPQTMAVSASARELIGQRIELQSVPVSSAMGDQLFWIELPGGSPYLVKLDSAAVAAGRTVPTAGNVRVIGRVMDKDDVVLQQWMERGVLRNDSDKMQAEFGTTYIEASRVTPAGG